METHRVLAKRLGFSIGTHRLLEQWRMDDSQNRYETYFLFILQLFNYGKMRHMPLFAIVLGACAFHLRTLSVSREPYAFPLASVILQVLRSEF